MLVREARTFFRDRHHAGKLLGDKLASYAGGGALVLAIPRGGVPVAIELASRLGASLDLVVPRKIAIPSNPEAGYGAVTEDGVIVLNQPLVRRLGLTQGEIQRHAGVVRAEIRRRLALYRGEAPFPPVAGRTVVIVDDGLASGFTMLAAVASVRRRGWGRVVVAVPVASAHAFEAVKVEADEVVSLVVADTPWFAVASFYNDWYDLTDDAVVAYLNTWRQRQKTAVSP